MEGSLRVFVVTGAVVEFLAFFAVKRDQRIEKRGRERVQIATQTWESPAVGTQSIRNKQGIRAIASTSKSDGSG